MMAKRFFIVCAGLLCLAITLHLTSDAARGQGTGSLIAVCDANTPTGLKLFAVDGGGVIYAGDGCFGSNGPLSRIGELPRGRKPTCMATIGQGGFIAIGCSNGDVFRFGVGQAPPVTPFLCTNAFGVSTPSQE
jgi:hypothetical protein